MCTAGHFGMPYFWLVVVFVTKSSMGVTENFVKSSYRLSNSENCVGTDPARDFTTFQHTSLLSRAAICLGTGDCSQFSYCKRNVAPNSGTSSQEADCTCYLKVSLGKSNYSPGSLIFIMHLCSQFLILAHSVFKVNNKNC